MMWAWHDYDVDEIAAALEIDANAAHQLLFRARRALRKQFEHEAGAENETRAAGARCR